jgi:hypothetical protein
VISMTPSCYGFFLLMHLTNNMTTHSTTNTSAAAEIYKTVLLIVIDFEGSSFSEKVVVLDWCLRLPSLLHIRAKSSSVSAWMRHASSDEIPVSMFRSIADETLSFRKVRLTYLPCPITEQFYRLDFENNDWLGIVNLFQTFEDLESVKDKQADIQAVRQVFDEDDAAQEEEALC